ncbi:hypothetical protein BKA93DRAFT_880000 [Sparassis latifolia]
MLRLLAGLHGLKLSPKLSLSQRLPPNRGQESPRPTRPLWWRAKRSLRLRAESARLRRRRRTMPMPPTELRPPKTNNPRPRRPNPHPRRRPSHLQRPPQPLSRRQRPPRLHRSQLPRLPAQVLPNLRPEHQRSQPHPLVQRSLLPERGPGSPPLRRGRQTRRPMHPLMPRRLLQRSRRRKPLRKMLLRQRSQCRWKLETFRPIQFRFYAISSIISAIHLYLVFITFLLQRRTLDGSLSSSGPVCLRLIIIPSDDIIASVTVSAMS